MEQGARHVRTTSFSQGIDSYALHLDLAPPAHFANFCEKDSKVTVVGLIKTFVS